MAFDPGLSTPTDRARSRLGDTADPPKILEATYAAVLASYAYDQALPILAETLGSWYVEKEASGSMGDQKVDLKGRAKYYFDLAKTLRDNLPPDTPAAGVSSAVGEMPESCYVPM